MTLAQNCALALLHLFDFKHWVATPICAPSKKKEEEEESDCTHLHVPETK